MKYPDNWYVKVENEGIKKYMYVRIENFDPFDPKSEQGDVIAGEGGSLQTLDFKKWSETFGKFRAISELKNYLSNEKCFNRFTVKYFGNVVAEQEQEISLSSGAKRYSRKAVCSDPAHNYLSVSYEHYLLDGKGNIVSVNTSIFDKNNPEHIGLIDQILSTFRFTD